MHDVSAACLRLPEASCLWDAALLPRIHYASLLLDCDADLSADADALAVKYLSDAQLAQLARGQAAQGQTRGRPTGFSPPASKHMSFASRRYMERYGLLGGAGDDGAGGDGAGGERPSPAPLNVAQFLESLADRSHTGRAPGSSPLLGGNLSQSMTSSTASGPDRGAQRAAPGATSTPAQPRSPPGRLPLTPVAGGRVLDIERLKELPKLL